MTFEFPSTSASPQSHGSSRVSFTIQAGGFNLIGSSRSENQSSENRSFEPAEIRYTELPIAFQAIKDSLQSVEAVEDLKARVAHVVARANASEKIGQSGLSRDLMEIAAGMVLEQQLLSMKVTSWVLESHVRSVVRQTAKELHLDMCNLSEFPRIIPNDVQARIAQLKELFNTFVIVYTNPKNEKVRDRDPILFGVLRAFPDRLYYVTDWIDEYCELTMEKFIGIAQSTLHDQWKVNEIVPNPTDEDLSALVDHVRNRTRTLEPTLLQRIRQWLRLH